MWQRVPVVLPKRQQLFLVLQQVVDGAQQLVFHARHHLLPRRPHKVVPALLLLGRRLPVQPVL
jgi:hypothetical protein